MPLDVHKIIYLDIDTYSCDDIAKLYDTVMHGKTLGAVFEHTYASNTAQFTRLGMGPEAGFYFNSGVLLMDLDAFRKRGLKARIMNYIRRSDVHLICPDQDALNGALWDETIELHPRWNWSDGWVLRCARLPLNATRWRGLKPIEALEAALYPGILHFWGPHKPWLHNHRPEGPRYHRTLRELNMAGPLLPGATWFKRFRAALYRLCYRFIYRWLSVRLYLLRRGQHLTACPGNQA